MRETVSTTGKAVISPTEYAEDFDRIFIISHDPKYGIDHEDMLQVSRVAR